VWGEEEKKACDVSTFLRQDHVVDDHKSEAFEASKNSLLTTNIVNYLEGKD
jgi:hypothetical protein